MTDTPEDRKYIVFKRDEFFPMVGQWFGRKGPISLTRIANECEHAKLDDAVVIRRQDWFASPALATYASMIAIATHLIPDGEHKSQLLLIADYFEQQAQLAAEEGWKIPDV